MLKRYPPDEIVPALVHHNRHVRRYAALMLGIGGDERLVPFLTDLLQSGSTPVRRVAARALGIPARPFSDPADVTRQVAEPGEEPEPGRQPGRDGHQTPEYQKIAHLSHG